MSNVYHSTFVIDGVNGPGRIWRRRTSSPCDPGARSVAFRGNVGPFLGTLRRWLGASRFRGNVGASPRASGRGEARRGAFPRKRGSFLDPCGHVLEHRVSAETRAVSRRMGARPWRGGVVSADGSWG